MDGQKLADKQPTTYLNFGQALQYLKEGKKVTRSVWGGYWEFADDAYLNYETTTAKQGARFENGIILAFLRDNKGVAPAQPYQADLLAEDWMIVE